jgi:hypothetical protein
MLCPEATSNRIAGIGCLSPILTDARQQRPVLPGSSGKADCSDPDPYLDLGLILPGNWIMKDY